MFHFRVCLSIFASLLALPLLLMLNSTQSHTDIAKLDLASKQALSQHCFKILERELLGLPYTRSEFPELKTNYEITIVNLYLQNQCLGQQILLGSPAQHNSLVEDLEEQLVNIIDHPRYKSLLEQHRLEEIQINIQLYAPPQALSLDALSKAKIKDSFELGVHGLQLGYHGRKAFVAASYPIIHNHKDHQKLLATLCHKTNLEENCYRNPDLELSINRYEVANWLSDHAGQVTELYRHHIPVQAGQLSAQFVKQRLGLAAHWFANNLQAQTKLLKYWYFPSSNAYSKKDNHVRQIASLWSAITLEGFLQESQEPLSEDIQAALERYFKASIEYYLAHMQQNGQGAAYLVVDHPSAHIKLCNNAFLIMAILALREDEREQYMPAVYKLAEAILQAQTEQGSFHTYYGADSLDKGIDFFPGEMMLSLMYMYQATDDKRYLSAVQRAFPFYRDYWRSNRNTPFIPWHTQVYYLLYQASPEQELADFVFEMNDWFIQEKQLFTPAPLKWDMHGGSPKQMPRAATGSLQESTTDAYALAKLVGDEQHMISYRSSILDSSRFLLQLQYTPETSFYLPAPMQAIGGFRLSLCDNRIRNDFVQHSLMGLLKAQRYGIFEAELDQSS